MIRGNLKLRRDYGKSKGIPFIKIADHVDVNFHPETKRVSGAPLADSVAFASAEASPRVPLRRVIRSLGRDPLGVSLVARG